MKRNVLIVEDDPTMRVVIKRTLTGSSLEIGEVYEAGNGREGLDVLNDNRVDLLFIDVNMPVMDGMEMLERIRKQPETRGLSVLIISTESNEERIKTIGQKNAGFVHKPFTPETLKNKIADTLGIVGNVNV